MAVVGLSFGSPTSGAGFDVSSTVSTIVSALRDVETPWSTELATLTGQDTAISSLGSLLSSLSTDLSTLTSFKGVMVEKTGSSSDTSVLELTSATSSATAGTHTVVVKNLATTGAGYLTELSSSSDTISGSISIAVGSSSSVTITLDDSDSTLSGLAAAINSSSAGVTASVITDSSGSRLALLSNTSGSAGYISVSSSLTDESNSSTALSYSNTVTPVDAKLTIDGVDYTSSTNTISNLIAGITFQVLSPSATNSSGSQTAIDVVIANYNTGVESAVAQLVTDYNAVVSAINVQEGTDSSGNTEPLYGTPTLSLLQQSLISAINGASPSGYLDYIDTGRDATISGSITLSVGSGSAYAFTTSSTVNTLDELAAEINSASLGVTADVVTSGSQETITFYSAVSGSSGDVVVSSSLTAYEDSKLSFSTSLATSSANAYAVLSAVSASADTLSGAITLQVGSGSSQTITLDSSDNTLDGLLAAINSGSYGVSASVVSVSSGYELVLTSNTSGSSGKLTMSSSLYDLTTKSGSALGYTHSSDLNTLASLGVTVSSSANGMLEFDASSLDTILNSDFSGVVGFFQNANSWGKSFATTLTNVGVSSTYGMLSLALSSNSSMESSLKDEISREESWISIQQAKLTAELTSANEILQELPSKLSSINELYSAITGYSSSS